MVESSFNLRTMSKKFKKKAESAAETARQTTRGLKKEQRGMDRERRKLEQEEKKIIAKIKECHKKNDLASAKIYGSCNVFMLAAFALVFWRFAVNLPQGLGNSDCSSRHLNCIAWVQPETSCVFEKLRSGC